VANAAAEKDVKNGNIGDSVFSLYFFNMPRSVWLMISLTASSSMRDGVFERDRIL
jgi:hypothetical protein